MGTISYGDFKDTVKIKEIYIQFASWNKENHPKKTTYTLENFKVRLLEKVVIKDIQEEVLNAKFNIKPIDDEKKKELWSELQKDELNPKKQLDFYSEEDVSLQ